MWFPSPRSLLKTFAVVAMLSAGASGLAAKELPRALELNLFENGSMDELTVRTEVYSYVEYLFSKDDFETLEIAAGELRSRNLRTPSGTSKLAWFDRALFGAVWLELGQDVKRQILEERIGAWIKAYPKSTTAHLNYAQLQYQIAWSYRGTGFVHEVLPENWKPFHAYIEKARQYLEDHEDVRNGDPRWDELLLRIAKVQGMNDENFDALSTAAIERNPDYYDLYFTAMERHLPKWAGSLAHVEDFAERAAAFTGKEEGQSLYARIYWAASQYQFDEKIFEQSAARWDTMREGFEDVLKQYPDTWNLYNYALFACYAGDKEKAGELLDRLAKVKLPKDFPDQEKYADCRVRMGII